MDKYDEYDEYLHLLAWIFFFAIVGLFSVIYIIIRFLAGLL